MSGSSGGVVYQGSPALTSPATPPYTDRYGLPFTLTAGSPIPPGVYLVTSNWSINKNGTTIGPFSPGICVSDGFATIATAGQAVPIGAKEVPPIWPWPAPWPLG